VTPLLMVVHAGHGNFAHYSFEATLCN